MEAEKIKLTADRKAYDKEYNRKYYLEHRDYWFKRHTCVCGVVYDTSHKWRHMKTKKHQEFMRLGNCKEETEKGLKEMNIHIIKK